MSFRTLSATLDGTPNDARVLDAALAIGRPSEARITAFYADIDPSDVPAAYVGDGMGVYLSQEMWDTFEKQIAAQCDAARAHFADWRQRSGLSDTTAQAAGPTARMVVEVGTTAKLLHEHGPLSDLIVTALPKPGEPAKSLALEAALFGTGRPVLAVPSSGAVVVAETAPIIIAWNGKAEAGRALASALPILSRSRGDILVATVGETADNQSLGPVLDYLAMHGIAARGCGLVDRPGGTGAILLEETTRIGAGLLVMGAYSHSRWRELVLGGVTHHVLKHAALPVLLAH